VLVKENPFLYYFFLDRAKVAAHKSSLSPKTFTINSLQRRKLKNNNVQNTVYALSLKILCCFRVTRYDSTLTVKNFEVLYDFFRGQRTENSRTLGSFT
jgi:hypothetical protein